MSEPLAERLSRFTPNAASLDRDTLLFAAGRASVRPSRRWKLLASILATSQLLTLMLLWPHASQPVPLGNPSVASHSSEPIPSPALDGRDISTAWMLRQQALSADLLSAAPPANEPMAPSEPPLRAFGTPPSTILN